MKKLFKLSAAALGGIAGFVAGMFCAFVLGLHEPVHVFIPAFTVSAAFAAFTIHVSSKLTSAASMNQIRTISGLAFVSAVAAFYGLIAWMN